MRYDIEDTRMPEDYMRFNEDYHLQNEEDNPDYVEEEYAPAPDMSAKYPHVMVKLIGEDGNSGAILGRVRRAMTRANVSTEEIKAFTSEATSGDYNNLLATAMRWVTVY